MKAWKVTGEDIQTLLQAQEDLNIKYTGKNWRKTVTKDKISSAIKTEFAEYLEVLTSKWKWWKDRPDGDVATITLEIVDVLHFLLTAILKERGLSRALKPFKKGEVDSITSKHKTLIFKTSDLTKVLVQESEYTTNLLKGNFRNTKSKTENMVGLSLDLIYSMCVLAKVSPDSIVAYYFKKNKFNHERVEGGYKTQEVASKETEKERLGNE